MRYGLSALLAAVILSCAARADNAAAVTLVEKLGGKVTRDDQHEGKPVIAVDLTHLKVTVADQKDVKELKQLMSPYLGGTQVTDAGLFLFPCLALMLGQAAREEPSAGPEQRDRDMGKPADTDLDGALPEGAIARFWKWGANSNKTTYGLGFAPNGSWLMVADSSSEVRLWDLSTGKPSRSFSVGARADVSEAVLSQDGRLLAAQTANGPTRGTLHVWDVESGRERWHRDTADLNVAALCFSPDGRILALAAKKTVHLWDAATGKESRVLADHAEDVLRVAFSPDGKLLASGDRAGEVRGWNMASGQLVHKLSPPPGSGTYYATCSLRFSPDGALLACGQNSQVLIWDTATWKEVGKLGDHEGAVHDLAFSPDGRTLATACRDTKVRLWEVATWEKRRQFEGHRGRVYHTDFSPDGRTVASGGATGEVLLWDVTGLATKGFRQASPLSAVQLENLWSELQGSDGACAFRAVCVLAAAPRQAVPFLKERLKPPTVGTAQVGRLLADLDADDFAVREKATAALGQLGKSVQPALRRALTESASAEVRRRVRDLLDKLESGLPPPELLVALRATEVLEIRGLRRGP